MKAKLTLTIDRELIPQAKRIAEARGVSLSSIVEDTFRQLQFSEQESFSSKWRGQFRVKSPPEGLVDPRFQKLSERYL